MTQVRTFAYSDAEAVTRLVFDGMRGWQPPPTTDADTIRRDMLTLDGQPDRRAFVAQADRIVGFVLWMAEPLSVNPRPQATMTDAHMALLFVAADHHGSGLAARLQQHALDDMRDRGFRHARLWTPSVALRARRFYVRTGWRATGRTMIYDGLPRLEHRRPLYTVCAADQQRHTPLDQSG